MHLGVIPDGNRRYAEKNGLAKAKAYRKAKNVIKEVGQQLEDREIEEVTFYLLSEENLARPDEELQDLYQLLEDSIAEVAEEFGERDFSFNWASTNPDALPEHLQEKLSDLEEEFNDGEKQINALISYDGKADVMQASSKISKESGEFTRDEMREHLQIKSDIDFVIRTGDNPARECLSGFPIWNASYAEFYHIKKNFPSVTLEDVEEALDHYQKLRRKKGR
ncbi:undecaprenyl diphosphate synthase family protein [Candidatus Nanohalovita haloferacivicina]|uniref:undecaprenyl diphosphate synthase family protein n=1 Tax=Candidatus Nanohalovita haloferacivicina TaxID=2978046 RepID=UPI00325F98E1|nr:Undecaprenyl pyrophosphate synthase [Candidatus Nanohalobia archaeon BNXNv]